MPIDDLFDERLATTSILEWTVEDVHYLLQSLGYPQYQHQLKGPLGSAGLVRQAEAADRARHIR